MYVFHITKPISRGMFVMYVFHMSKPITSRIYIYIFVLKEMKSPKLITTLNNLENQIGKKYLFILE